MASLDAPPVIVVPKSARTPLVTRSRELVESSALQQRVFDSWEQFHEHLSAYGQRTAQVCELETEICAVHGSVCGTRVS